ncbi:hypothetical protein CAEBREN_08244 [Caenorhabditis brenneri]|uniref:Uncharacterized protein n=1 Tax=Caenorhabditis brenneri TaxID=135651 RepID=G0NM96_CAEBE|nr:hypothetical protein CAEBREN_08244 [Caenorhabditis brenneri]
MKGACECLPMKSPNCHVCGGPYDATKMVILNPEPEQLELYKSKWEAEKAEKAAAKKDKAKKIAEKMEAAAGYGSTSSGNHRLQKLLEHLDSMESERTSKNAPSNLSRIVFNWSEIKELELTIKKLAANGHIDAARQLAKHLVQLKSHKTKNIGASARVSGVQTQNAHMKSITKMNSAMGTTVKTMKEMNLQMPLEKVAANMGEFQMQQEKMGLTGQMMNDTLDSILDAPEDTEEQNVIGANFFLNKM